MNLGQKESLQNIINALKKSDDYFVDSHQKIKQFITHFEATKKNNCISSDKKLEIIDEKIKKFNQIKLDKGFYNILNEAEFYKNILLNTAAHNDLDADIFKKEAERTITLLKFLRNKLNKLKNNKDKE